MNSSSEYELPKLPPPLVQNPAHGSVDTGSRVKPEMPGHQDDYSSISIDDDIYGPSTEMREMTASELSSRKNSFDASDVIQKGFVDSHEDQLPHTSDVDINIDTVREKVTDVIVHPNSDKPNSPLIDKPSAAVDRTSKLENDLRTTAKNFALRNRSASSKLNIVTMLAINTAPKLEQFEAFQVALTELVSTDWFETFKDILLSADDFNPKYTSVISHYNNSANMHAFVILMFRLFANMELSYAEYLANNQSSGSDSSRDLIDSNRSGSDSSNNISSPKGYSIALIRCFAYVFQRIKIREKQHIHPDFDTHWSKMNQALFLA
jgi:hypothetical protein